MIRKNSLHLLTAMKKLKESDLSHVIEHLSDETINDICECIYNVIHTDLNMSKSKRNKLKKHIKTKCSVHRIKKIVDAKTPISKRRKALKMEGRGLPFILASVIPFLTSLFTRK